MANYFIFWVFICIFGLSSADELKNGKEHDFTLEEDIPMLIGLGIFESGPDVSENGLLNQNEYQTTEVTTAISAPKKKNRNKQSKAKLKASKHIMYASLENDQFKEENKSNLIASKVEDIFNAQMSTTEESVITTEKKTTTEIIIKSQLTTLSIKDIKLTTPAILIETTEEPLTREEETKTKETTKSIQTTFDSICNGFGCELYDNLNVSVNPNALLIVEGTSVVLNCSIDESENNTLNFKPIFNWDIKTYTKDEIRIKNQNSLNLANVAVEDSGIYVCILTSHEGCCKKTAFSSVIVYRAPNYMAHLIIIASICAAQICICFPLVIHKRKRMQWIDPNKEEEEEQNLLT